MIVNKSLPNLASDKKRIRGVISDVDGILTDGKIYFSSSGEQFTSFHAYDGFGAFNLINAGITLAIISGRHNPAITHRCQNDLGIKEVHLGIEDKLALKKALSTKYDIAPNEWIVIGDDINDLPLFDNTTLSVTVPEALIHVRERAALITERRGGEGAFRELSDWILSR